MPAIGAAHEGNKIRQNACGNDPVSPDGKSAGPCANPPRSPNCSQALYLLIALASCPERYPAIAPRTIETTNRMSGF